MLDHEVEVEGRTEVEIDSLIRLTDRKGRYAHSVLFLKLLHDRFLTDVDEWSLDRYAVPREYSNFQLEPSRYVQFVRRFNQEMFALRLPQYFQPDIGE